MITYTNRKEQTYYLKVGTTKKGKLRYYASMNESKGDNAAEMPEGFVFSENVNGQVSVGKPKSHEIEDSEIECVRRYIGKLKCSCREEIKGKSVVLHTTGKPMFSDIHPIISAEQLRAYHEKFSLYQPMLRFYLVDKAKRYFQTERMCFIGEPDWLRIGDSSSLKSLAKKYIPLLDDEEALFEEIY